ncbi:DMT family transporter [Candidatus Sodalis sp. SoCistrobi]|uniref:DMT family transporter n=1 Tax=Candidatus Sodalis sp. SoCistrobi TaxID=1922216 RepID=UPI00093CD227|nr:DMT family transporter [Candidatus Sodalis sp. SoCistrobi]
MTIRYRMGISEWGMLLGLSLLWGGSFFFNRLALRELPPLTVVMLRVGLGALAMWLLLRLLRLSFPTGLRLWPAFMLMGLLNNVIPFTLIVWGQLHIASGLAAILNATTPLFSLLVGWLGVGGARPARRQLAGVVTGFGGVAVMTGVGLQSAAPSSLAGQLAVLGAALSYACAGVYGRRFAVMGLNPLLTACGQVSASALVLLPLTLFADRPWTLPSPNGVTWGAIAGLALLSTALAYVLFFQLLARAGTLNLMLVTFLIPVSATLLGGLVLHERLQGTELAGMVIILLALIIIDGRLGRRLFRREASRSPP